MGHMESRMVRTLYALGAAGEPIASTATREAPEGRQRPPRAPQQPERAMRAVEAAVWSEIRRWQIIHHVQLTTAQTLALAASVARIGSILPPSAVPVIQGPCVILPSLAEAV